MRLGWTGRGVAAAAIVLSTAQGALADMDPAALLEKVQAIANAYVSDTASSEQATGISISVSLSGDADSVNVASAGSARRPTLAR